MMIITVPSYAGKTRKLPARPSALIYILDAYNVLHKMRRFQSALDKSLQSAREALTAQCAALVERRGDIVSIILVFDGRSEFRDLPQKAPKGIRLVFSETNEDADDRIATVLEELPKKPEKMVVSDDNSVRNHARAYGVRSQSVAEFEAVLMKAETKTRPQKSKPEKPALPSDVAAKITEAYKKSLGL
jgi:predicted RNA-binding protein with PIN domain